MMTSAGSRTERTDKFPRPKLYGLGSVLSARVHAAQRRGVNFCEAFATLIMAEALNAVAVISKFPAVGAAVVAGHEALLDFSAE
jgi:hypothetical protein